ncbi:MAG TPA: hypothetical protein DCZ95_12030 [Verrucomicrobia bacterium]|nr:MAG: hypothetical protein A2X46_14080 [Lentisphaerae bacterium GWF2_57_35]HBA84813.1 hypothetical protein [Verrucomicrobiota bacterium]
MTIFEPRMRANRREKKRRIYLFQSLENPAHNFPIIGKTGSKFSNHWKIAAFTLLLLEVGR